MSSPEHEQNAETPSEHTGPEVAAGAESLSGGNIGPAHTGPEVAAGAESLSGGQVREDHLARRPFLVAELSPTSSRSAPRQARDASIVLERRTLAIHF
jgi:hypothetical protein